MGDEVGRMAVRLKLDLQFSWGTWMIQVTQNINLVSDFQNGLVFWNIS